VSDAATRAQEWKARETVTAPIAIEAADRLADDVLALVAELERVTRERDDWRDGAKGAEHNEAMTLGDLAGAREREIQLREVAEALANESARAVTEPRRFHENEDGRQQALAGALTAVRGVLAGLPSAPPNAVVVDYAGPDESIECAYPGCTRRLRYAAFGAQFCSKAHETQLREASKDADEWLTGIEDTFASPNRECSQEDVNPDGTREGNTCIDSEPSDLDFPDDWCERCYTLFVVRQARSALAGLPSAPLEATR
jgi:hypothetical protein